MSFHEEIAIRNEEQIDQVSPSKIPNKIQYTKQYWYTERRVDVHYISILIRVEIPHTRTYATSIQKGKRYFVLLDL